MASFRPVHCAIQVVPIALIFLTAARPARSTVHVWAGAPGPVHDGLTWETAFTGLQAAVDTGDPVIWVAAGVYTGAVTIPKSATVLGGFAAMEPETDARDPRANLTVLEAPGSPILVNGEGAGSIFLDGFTLHGTPDGTAVAGCSTVSRCVITNSGTGVAKAGLVRGCVIAGNTVGVLIQSAATVAGCLLQGNATAIDTTATTTVSGNTLVGNGSAVKVRQAALNLGNNILAWNAIGLDTVGTGVVPEYNCVYGNGADSSAGTVFSVAYGNMAVDPRLTGGAVGEIHLLADSPCREAGANRLASPLGPEWDGNARIWPAGGTVDMGADEYDGTAYTVQPGVTYVGAGGNDTADGRSALSARRTLAGAQEALFGRGGEIRVLAGTLATSTTLYLPVALTGRWMQNGWRGGMPTILTGDEESAALTVASRVAPLKVNGITVRGAGTGVDVTMGDALLTCCILCGNLDAVAASGGRPGLVNCTVAGNQRGLALYTGTASAVNTIFANNAAGIHYEAGAGGTPLVRYCLFNGNFADTEGIISPVGSSGNRNLLPSFADDAHGNFHLVAGSAAIAGGDPLAWAPNTRDMDDEAPRISGPPDIGADQFHADTPAWEPRTVYVTPDGDDAQDGLAWDHSKQTIAAAIQAAEYPGGGTVRVAAGTYVGPVQASLFVALVGGHARGSAEPDPAHNPTILTAPKDTVLAFAGGHTYGSVSGFTISGGESGVSLRGASPTLTGNTITGNTTAIVGWDASPKLVRNTVRGNTAGMHFEGGHPRLYGNTVRGQVLDGVACWDGTVDARGNAFLGNTGAGLYVSAGSAQAVNNTYIGNQTGVAIVSAEATVGNSIFVANAVGARVGGDASKAAFLSNDFWANAVNAVGADEPVGMTRNVGLNPDVASLTYGEPHIQPGSICRRQGDPALLAPGQVDIDGQPVSPLPDIGADQSDGLWTTVTPAVVRVSPSGNDAMDGASWYTAKRTLQAGLDALAASGGQLWVAQGTYAAPVAVPAFVHAYAGFAGNETALGTRNTQPDATSIDGAGLALAVKLRGGGPAGATWDGFTVWGSRLGIFSAGGGARVANNTIAGTGTDAFLEDGGASLFTRNSVHDNGSGVTLTHAFTTVLNNAISGNGLKTVGQAARVEHMRGAVRARSGGAPVIAGNLLTGNESGVATDDTAARILNNTMVGNGYGVAYAITIPEIVNNIIASSAYGVYPYGVNAGPTLRSNDVFGCTTPYVGIADQTGQRGNLAVDPIFRTSGSYHLGPGSPCIDAGDSSVVFGTDMDGRARPIGAAIDIGAYEYAAPVFGIADAVKALKSAGGLWQPSPDEATALEADGNPGIDVRDAARILRDALGVD